MRYIGLLILLFSSRVSAQLTDKGCDEVVFPYQVCDAQGKFIEKPVCTNDPSQLDPPAIKRHRPICVIAPALTSLPTIQNQPDRFGDEVQVFDPQQVASDALAGAAQWNTICPPSGEINTDCCAEILFTTDESIFRERKFDVQTTPAVASSDVSFDPETCEELECDPDDRPVIFVNNTDVFHRGGFTENQDLIPGLHHIEFYTGPTSPISTSDKHAVYSLISLRELMLHELGHIAGLVDVNLSDCPPDGEMRMKQGRPNNVDARDLTCLDKCMFHKLYCPDEPFDCGTSGVAQEESPINRLDFSIYPNPARSVVHLTFPSILPSARIEMIDDLGQVLFSQEVNATSVLDLNIINFPTGIYYLRIESRIGKGSRRLVIMR